MSDIPGGYVTTGSPMKYRPYAGSQTTIWDLQCVEVAAPGVDVIGGTMTYGALLNFFDTYANMLSANSTYYDLLELMASPDDLVVL